MPIIVSQNKLATFLVYVVIKDHIISIATKISTEFIGMENN